MSEQSPNEMSVLQRLARPRRESLGKLQREIAEAIGVTPAALCQFEKGKASLSEGRRQALCRVLGLSWPPAPTPEPAPASKVLKFCGDSKCLDVEAYIEDAGDVRFQPAFYRARSDRRTFCPRCTKQLHDACPHCRAPVVQFGRGCLNCGRPYIAIESGMTVKEVLTRRELQERLRLHGTVREYHHYEASESSEAEPTDTAGEEHGATER